MQVCVTPQAAVPQEFIPEISPAELLRILSQFQVGLGWIFIHVHSVILGNAALLVAAILPGLLHQV